VESLLEGLAATSLAQWMSFSRWGYAIVNTTHVLGIALLVGAIVPLDLKLLGAWRGSAIGPLAKILVPMAVGGLTLAIVTGSLLFLADPLEYAGSRIFIIKIALIAAATLHALSFHLGKGYSVSAARLKIAGGCSLTAWLSVLVLGRFIAFAGD
jgi:hypothetical protein